MSRTVRATSRLLTPRGRTVGALALTFFVAGRLLALRELHMAAAALATLLAVAAAGVALRRGALEVRRSVTPGRVTAGGEVRVELVVTNRGWLGGGPVLLEDALPPRLQVSARLALPPLPPGAERRVSYVLRPPLRGRYTLGPLDVVLTDPFALVVRRYQLPGTSTLVVYPARDQLRTLPLAVQRVGAVRRSPLLGQGDEFYALRPYQEGDDLRKVHWPSSMRVGEVVVRQEELLREPGLVVLLDTCAAKHRGRGATASLEAAVSACASVACLAVRLGTPVTILTSGGPLLRTRRPAEEEVLEALATVEPSPEPSLAPVLGSPFRRGLGGASLVVITPGLSRPEVGRAAELAAGASGGAAVLVDAESFVGGGRRRGRAEEARLAALGLPVLRLGAGDRFAEVWEEGVRGVAVAR